MRAGRVAGLATFMIRTNLRSAITVGGFLTFVAIALLGPVMSLRRGTGWTLDPDLLFYGYLTAGLFVVRSGLEQQRETGLQLYLRHNLATPVEHGLGAVWSVAGTWAILTVALFVLGVICSGGDAASAAWYAWAFGLPLAVFLPAVLMVEAVSSLRIPLIIPVLLYLALAVILALTVGEARMAAALALTPDRGDPATSLRIAMRVLAVVPSGMAIFLTAVWLRGRRSGSRAGAGASDC